MIQQGGDAVESEEPVTAGSTAVRMDSIVKGGYCVIQSHVCKTTDVAIARTGKLGAAKVVITGIGLFNGKTYVEEGTAGLNVTVPLVNKSVYQLTDIRDGKCDLLLDDGSVRSDFLLPVHNADLYLEINELFEASKTTGTVLMVTVLKAHGQETIVEVASK